MVPLKQRAQSQQQSQLQRQN